MLTKSEEDTADVTTVGTSDRLDSVGLITCSFYFLEKPSRKSDVEVSRKTLPQLGPVSEKDVKGEALSHQAV